MSKFSREHYEVIVRILRDANTFRKEYKLSPKATIDHTINRFVLYFLSDNHNFDVSKFMRLIYK